MTTITPAAHVPVPPQVAEARAGTWNTIATVTVYKDGHGNVSVTRRGAIILNASWNAETETEPATTDHIAIKRAQARLTEDHHAITGDIST